MNTVQATTPATSGAPRMSWVDIAKALSIFLVVMYHSTLGVGDAVGEAGFMHYVLAFATPFRMPEFFLISGLFLSAVIARPWKQFADRRAVHYLYFYALWALILIVVKTGLGSGSPVAALEYAVWAIIQPYGVLWFIYMLAIFGLVAKLLWQFRVPHWAALGVAAILQILPISSPSYIITQFAEYFVFFYAGYALAPSVFKLMERVSNAPLLGLLGLIAWACLNFAMVFSDGFALTPDHVQMGYASVPGVRLMLALAGSVAVCTMAALLAKTVIERPLAFVGANSIVIYLSFTIPMAITRVVLVRLGIIDDAGILSLIVIAVSFLSPLVLLALINKIGWGKFLFNRPRWAHLPGTYKGDPRFTKRTDAIKKVAPAE